MSSLTSFAIADSRECERYDDVFGAETSTRDLLETLSDSFDDKAFGEIWVLSTIAQPEDGRDPLRHIILGISAIERGQYLRGLASLDIASARLNAAKLCERETIDFLIYALRRFAVMGVADHADVGDVDINVEHYRALTGGINYPHLWITEREQGKVICLVKIIASEGFEGFHERFLYECGKLK